MAEMTEQLETAPGRRGRATIREIADLAGVSIATVSRVVNGRGDVSDETRELVQRVVREHGYSANRSARGLSGGRTGLIGGTVPMLHYPYFSHVLFGVSEALYEQDMRLVLCPTMHEHEREVTLLERLLHGTTDGAVIILPEETSDELEQLLNHGYRFVVIDPQQPLNERIPAVSAAHTAGAAQAMEHLLSLGHRRIGAITGPRGGKATADRRRGYYAALAEAGIAPDPALEIESNFELPGGAAAAERLLSLPEPPTAIFAFNDNMAIGTMQVARARGIRVPEELSIIGFDDLDEASIVNPALTTIRQPLAEMGRIAVSLLTRLLDNQRLEALHVELATRLVVRESTAAPRG
jgi:LacI family transcriptional regulator, galactose operon repressor